jgi:hypothetical protein
MRALGRAECDNDLLGGSIAPLVRKSIARERRRRQIRLRSDRVNYSGRELPWSYALPGWGSSGGPRLRWPWFSSFRCDVIESSLAVSACYGRRTPHPRPCHCQMRIVASTGLVTSVLRAPRDRADRGTVTRCARSAPIAQRASRGRGGDRKRPTSAGSRHAEHPGTRAVWPPVRAKSAIGGPRASAPRPCSRTTRTPRPCPRTCGRAHAPALAHIRRARRCARPRPCGGVTHRSGAGVLRRIRRNVPGWGDSPADSGRWAAPPRRRTRH